MTNAERILQTLRGQGPMSDAELRTATGIEPHQQVNQICRRLADKGLIHRAPGPHRTIINTATSPTPLLEPSPALSPVASARPGSLSRPSPPKPRLQAKTLAPDLVILPCSKRKATGGKRPSGAGPSVLGPLPSDLARRLREARASVAARAGLDERLVMPAWRRYVGELYTAAGAPLQQAVESGRPLLILSGGYGLVLANEPIGVYDRAFNSSDWPKGLLEDCVVAATQAMRCHQVAAFCASTTGYAKVIRRTPWAAAGLQATLVSPDAAGRGGAMVLVPRASGEALAAALSGPLSSGWRSSDGLAVTMEDCS